MTHLPAEALSSLGTLLGFIIVFFVLIVYHGICLWGATAIYRHHAANLISHKRYLRMEIFFFMGVSGLALIHLSEIGALSFLGYRLGLAPDMDQAIVIVGGIYTTIGAERAVAALPGGYRLLAVVLSMSSLFCFAWSTAVMMDMMRTYHAAKRARGGVTISD
jgi:hypothetical protein